jgi:hypothetical protein
MSRTGKLVASTATTVLAKNALPSSLPERASSSAPCASKRQTWARPLRPPAHILWRATRRRVHGDAAFYHVGVSRDKVPKTQRDDVVGHKLLRINESPGAAPVASEPSSGACSSRGRPPTLWEFLDCTAPITALIESSTKMRMPSAKWPTANVRAMASSKSQGIGPQ